METNNENEIKVRLKYLLKKQKTIDRDLKSLCTLETVPNFTLQASISDHEVKITPLLTVLAHQVLLWLLEVPVHTVQTTVTWIILILKKKCESGDYETRCDEVKELQSLELWTSVLDGHRRS